MKISKYTNNFSISYSANDVIISFKMIDDVELDLYFSFSTAKDLSKAITKSIDHIEQVIEIKGGIELQEMFENMERENEN